MGHCVCKLQEPAVNGCVAADESSACFQVTARPLGVAGGFVASGRSPAFLVGEARLLHLHSAPAARVASPSSSSSAHAPSAVNDLPACGADLCSAADAPHSTAPSFQSLAAGAVTFGAARLLTENLLPFATVRSALLAAPKTSPPV